MTLFANDGLELWYATPDAPAPQGSTEDRERVSVTVRVRPSSPANAVRIHYRVDGGAAQHISAMAVANDYERQEQSFRADFPTFWTGQMVEYLPMLTCAGRRAPDPRTALTYPSVFQLGDPVAATNSPVFMREPDARFRINTEYLATARVQMVKKPEILGDTPAGTLLIWNPAGGTVDGPALHATVRPEGEHEITVRPDGVGVINVRVTLETDDGALLAIQYSGIIDLGPAGAQSIVTEHFTPMTPIRIAPTLLTSSPRYTWLNRLQCVGIGEVRPLELLYIYDLYALR